MGFASLILLSTVPGFLVVIVLQLLNLWRTTAMATDIQDLTDAEGALALAVSDAIDELQALASDVASLTDELSTAQDSGDAAAIESATAALKDKAAALEGAVAAAKAAASAQAAAAPASAVPPAPAVILTLSPDTLPDATIGESYSAQVAASGGEPPYAYSTADLPAGLVLGAGGAITGTPSGPAGTTAVEIAAHDANSDSGSITYELNVVGAAAAAAPAAEVSAE